VAAPPLVKIAAPTAAEVCARFQPPRDALALLRDGMAPREYLAALLDGKKYVPGIEFLAHALPLREGIWWGCLCLQHAFGDALSPFDRAAAIAAVQWVLRPGEDTRTAARVPSEAAGPASVAGALASAAFLSGGNVAPPGTPPTAPALFAYAKAVARAVKLASIQSPPTRILDTQRAVFELGIEIAEGRFI
jgi:hypothetical protein